MSVIKNRPFVTKKHMETSIYIYIDLVQPDQKTMEIFIWKNNTKNLRKPYRFVTNC